MKSANKLAFGVMFLSLVAPLTATVAEAQSWAVGVGAFDVANEARPEAMLEYRFKPFTIKSIPLIPAVGLAGSTDGNFWGYVGLRYDFKLVGSLYAVPQFGVGLYERGDGKNLGGAIEFRSGLELAFELKKGQRIGLIFYHLSNSSIYRLNPGSNSLVLTWSKGR